MAHRVLRWWLSMCSRSNANLRCWALSRALYSREGISGNCWANSGNCFRSLLILAFGPMRSWNQRVARKERSGLRVISASIGRISTHYFGMRFRNWVLCGFDSRNPLCSLRATSLFARLALWHLLCLRSPIMMIRSR